MTIPREDGALVQIAAAHLLSLPRYILIHVFTEVVFCSGQSVLTLPELSPFTLCVIPAYPA